MLPRPYSIVLIVLATASATACAQTPASAPAGATATAASAPAPMPIVTDPRLLKVRLALEAAERGDFDAGQGADLAGHPLLGWVEYAALRRNVDAITPARAQDFLARFGDQASGAAFRELWLAAVTRREDWASFQAAWKPGIKDTALRCAELSARQATGRADARWTEQAQAIWRSSGGKPLPGACDAPLALLAAQGGLSPAMRWERIDAAAEQSQPSVMRAAARGLPGDEAALAQAYAGFIETVNDSALRWPKTERSRRMASYGLARLAKSSPDGVEARLPGYAQALNFSEADRGRVLYEIALWTVASYGPESARRLAAVPLSSYDERLHEWQAREAMARSDWRQALDAIRRMPSKQRSDSRWQYFEARLAERLGEKSAAQAIYREAARKPEFHGFLAADRINQPYPLCPWVPQDSAAERAAVARDPAIVRAIGLQQLQRPGWAVREWDSALARFSDAQRRIAVEAAQQAGWFDRAVFSLGKQDADELRLYALRFPLHHDAVIRREAAKNALDPAWIAAEIRAESIFDPNVRSGANAMGLMQILPATGASVAARIGIPWRGAQSLYEPETNIILGSAYLRQLMDKYGGQPYFAIAGYNAGPAPLSRWQAQRPEMDADFWIETISYKETRDYVARVLAFSVIYDWRLNGDALTLSDRLRGRINGPRKSFVCPTPSAPATPAQMVPEVNGGSSQASTLMDAAPNRSPVVAAPMPAAVIKVAPATAAASPVTFPVIAATSSVSAANAVPPPAALVPVAAAVSDPIPTPGTASLPSSEPSAPVAAPSAVVSASTARLPQQHIKPKHPSRSAASATAALAAAAADSAAKAKPRATATPAPSSKRRATGTDAGKPASTSGR